MAEPYRKEIDFAFFAANFGYSKAEYEELTLREKAFLQKAWEERQISDSYLLYNAMFTAVYNARRPKNKRALKLWKKKSVRRADQDVVKENLASIREAECRDGTDWVRKIYQANGWQFPGEVKPHG